MASYTPNYNLKKPADADSYDIADANGNMDIIDGALNTQNSKIETLNVFSDQAVHSTSGSFTKQLTAGHKYLVVVDRYSVTSSNYGGLYFVDFYSGGSHVSAIKESSGLTAISVADTGVISYTTGIGYMRLIFIHIG